MASIRSMTSTASRILIPISKTTRDAPSRTAAGIDGCILADLPLEEAGGWAEAADSAGVETVLLAAPTAPDERLPRICARSRGFVYAVSLVGITGERRSLAGTALDMARRLKAVTDRPVIAGIGISDAGQAAEACSVADGVVIASLLMRQRLEGATVEQVAATVRGVREALDAAGR